MKLIHHSERFWLAWVLKAGHLPPSPWTLHAWSGPNMKAVLRVRLQKTRQWLSKFLSLGPAAQCQPSQQPRQAIIPLHSQPWSSLSIALGQLCQGNWDGDIPLHSVSRWRKWPGKIGYDLAASNSMYWCVLFGFGEIPPIMNTFCWYGCICTNIPISQNLENLTGRQGTGSPSTNSLFRPNTGCF